MKLLERLDRDAADLERSVEGDRVEGRSPPSPPRLGRLEGIGETLADPGQHGRITIGIDDAAGRDVELAHIVDAIDVIGMGVGVEQRVDPLDTRRQALHAQIGRRIDQQPGRPLVDQDRTALAPIARLGGRADGTAAADHRDAGRGAAAEHGHAHAAALAGAALANRRKKLSVVARAISATGSAFTSARVAATWAT